MSYQSGCGDGDGSGDGSFEGYEGSVQVIRLGALEIIADPHLGDDEMYFMTKEEN